MPSSAPDYIRSIIYPELATFPHLKHGLFPKQHPPEGFVRAATQEEVRQSLQAKYCCFLRQVHSTSLICVESSVPKGVRADGMVTSIPGISLHIKHSDCQAAFIYDIENHVIANVHCGWRSLLGNIYAQTINTMKRKYHSKPQDLFVLVAPSLGPQHAIYPDYQTLFPKSFFPFVSNCHIDFRAIARKQFLELGVLKKNLHISERCTYEEHSTFFSFRYKQQHQPEKKPNHRNIVSHPPHNNISAIMLTPRA